MNKNLKKFLQLIGATVWCFNLLSAAAEAPEIKIEVISTPLINVSTSEHPGIERMQFGLDAVFIHDSKIKFSPDGKIVAVWCLEGIRISCIESGSFLPAGTSLKIDVPAVDVAFSPDSRFILVGTGDGRVILIELQTRVFAVLYKNKPRRYSIEPNSISAVAFSCDGKLVSWFSRFDALCVCDLKRKVVIASAMYGQKYLVECDKIVFSHNSQFLAFEFHLASVIDENSVSVYLLDLQNGKIGEILKNDSGQIHLQHMYIDSQDKYVYLATTYGDIFCCDVCSNKIIARIDNLKTSSWNIRHPGYFSNDLRFAVYASPTFASRVCYINIINVDNPKKIVEFDFTGAHCISCAAISPDTRKIAVCLISNKSRGGCYVEVLTDTVGVPKIESSASLIALATVQHPRCGANSPAQIMTQSDLRVIAEYLHEPWMWV